MAENLTADKVRSKYIAAMPEHLGDLYYELYNQAAWIHFKWMDFCRLYARDQETVDLVNEEAPAFFHNLQRMMWEDVLLHLCRITDPPKSAGKDTLTIRRIASLSPDPAVREQIEALTKDAEMKTKFARDWRNRRLAHRELPPSAGGVAEPLGLASREQVDAALASIRDTLNFVERHFMGTEVWYERSIGSLGGIESLLSCLKDGVDARRAELEVLRNGGIAKATGRVNVGPE